MTKLSNMAKKSEAFGGNDDWKCCEQCAYCLTIFFSILFLVSGAAMAIYSALLIWSDIDLATTGLETMLDSIEYSVFIVGICIAGTAILGMVSAGCAKAAATPDGKCDGCEKCCTGLLALLYLIILFAVFLAAGVVAGILSYYFALIQNGGSVGGTECPYPADDEQFFLPNSTTPDVYACPLDNFFFDTIYSETLKDNADADNVWVSLQDLSVTCGYDCDSGRRVGSDVYYCKPDYVGGIYSQQTTGTFCTNSSSVVEEEPEFTVYTGTNLDGVANAFPTDGATTTMPFRPTLYENVTNYMLPMLVVWWCIFVLALVLIVSAFVMCCRKKKTKKNSAKYKPGENPSV